MADVTDLTSGSDQVRESSLILALGYVRLGRVVWITICSGDGPDKIDPGKNGFITTPTLRLSLTVRQLGMMKG